MFWGGWTARLKFVAIGITTLAASSGCDPETRALVTSAGATAVAQIATGLVQLLFATLGLAQGGA